MAGQKAVDIGIIHNKRVTGDTKGQDMAIEQLTTETEERAIVLSVVNHKGGVGKTGLDPFWWSI